MVNHPSHVVLLGDSIFDNAAFVPDGPAVINHLQGILPAGWQVSLLARDGDVTADVEDQLSGMPVGASHLVISVGGNDALMSLDVFPYLAGTVRDALSILAKVQKDFQRGYRAMLRDVLALELPMAVCTIYDAVPDLSIESKAALSLFNDTIMREATRVAIPVIDIRHECTELADYSSISRIEPSEQGGRKIALAISDWLTTEVNGGSAEKHSNKNMKGMQ